MRNRMRKGLAISSLALATLLLITAFLLMQVIAPHTALADASWTDTSGGASFSGYSLAYDSGHNLLYAGTYGQGVWKYDGTTWTDTDGGVSSYEIYSLAYDSGQNLLYAGTNNHGVWKYDGTNWTDTDGGVSSYRIPSLACDSGHNLLYAGTAGHGVWKYNGTTWTDTDGGVSSHILYIFSLAYDSTHNLLYAGTDLGVWKYNGTTWTNTGGGMSSDENMSLAYDSGHNLLYAGTSDNGVWKYDGTTWTDTSGGGAPFSSYSLAYDSGQNALYAGTSGHGVWKYDGTNWTDTGGGVSSYIIASLACDPGHSLLYAGTYNNGVWKYSTGPPVPPADQWKSTFYFAEGYTGTNFQEYATLENPNAAAADAWITFMFTDGTSQSQYYSLAPTSRLTVDINQLAGAGKELSMRVVSTSPGIVAERPMYFNYKGFWSGGSDAVGATAPNASWYFAEGNTLSGFDQYVTVLNPGDATANLTFHYMVEGQGEQDTGGQVAPHSRATFKTRDQIGANLNASLYLSSNQAVVAERPMYFNYLGLAANNWTGGHDVVGTNSPQKQWYLAEGTTRGGFEEWLCLENPGSSDITVNATYQLGSGQGDPINKSYTVPAKQRLTVSVNREIGPEKDDSVFLSSTSDFIAERPMYFNYHNVWTGGHDVLGANNSAKTWYFAEGTTRDNFDEWLCLQNPGNADAHVNITYYTTSGQANNKPWTVSANSRLTINVNQDAGANQDISAKVSSDKPIIVERPMYFDYNGWTGGHDVVGFAPPLPL
jgi:Family of unknown function (DUF5719)